MSFRLNLPLWNIKNIRIYYILSFLTSLWFIAGNWIFFWTKFMTFGQLGIVDATAFAFGLLLEVPTGAISDLIGKRKTIIIAMGLACIGTMMMAFSVSLLMLWVAFLITQLGWSFYSGSAEALAYDTLVENNQEKNYDRVVSLSGTISSIASISATLLGGLLYIWWFRSTHFVWSLGYLVAFVISFRLIEPKVDSKKFSISNYFTQLSSGMKNLFLPNLLPYVLVILALMGASYLYEWGLVKPTMAKSFGFMAQEQSLILAGMTFLSALLVTQIPKIRQFISDKKGLYLLTLVMGAGFMLAYLPLGIFGVFPMLLISLSGHLSYPWISAVVNQEVDSEYRATALSTVALLTKIPYTLLAIVAGNMAENNTFRYFNLSIGMVIIFTVLLGSILLKLRAKSTKPLIA